MIQISDKSLCCGCGACASRCPKQCISMFADDEGFLYPHVNKNTCIECGTCEKVCHELHPFETRVPIKVLAACNMDYHAKMASSSGGVFALFCEQIIRRGGCVYGAKFEEDWQVSLVSTDLYSKVGDFCGSKYVQADTKLSFLSCEKLLDQGRLVLFSASPCQIAALKHFLRREYDNLITVDFACHGVPSPLVWSSYLTGLSRTAKDVLKIRSVSNDVYREWYKYKTELRIDGNELSLISTNTSCPYLVAMKENLILRPCCHNCKAGEGRSMSDITMADFWGIERYKSETDYQDGYSILKINTRKGKILVEQCQIESFNVPFLEVENNFKTGCAPSEYRDDFFANVRAGKSVPDILESILNKQQVPLSIIKWKLIKTFKDINRRIEIIRQRNKFILASDCCIRSINFRDKTYGWKQYSLKINIK